MAELLDKFPERIKSEEKYRSLFDGQVWKVKPEEYDFEPNEMKAFLASLKLLS